ncbi:MAG TPA: hypothetical protein VMW76_08555 [Bacteroidales bacterium]|nr:hypothetical protein [Bacteroidales bacterium]
MKTILKNPGCWLALLASVLVMTGCSATKTAKTVDPGLKYKLSGSSNFSYTLNAEVTQSIDVGGQDVGATILSSTGFTLTPGQAAAGVIPLKVTIDTVGITIQSPQGNLVETKSELKGRQFNMTISEFGKEDNLDEAEEIKYMVAGQQESNLKGTFVMLFPDLPEITYKEGTSWTDNDTIDISTSSDNAMMIMQSENIFAGTEEFEGYHCVRINSRIKGERTSVSNTPQGQITTDGALEGESSFLFVPDQGILVWAESNVTMKGYVSVPTGDSYPLQVITKYVTKLVK